MASTSITPFPSFYLLTVLSCSEQFMLDEWGVHARSMKSTADHRFNRNACCLSVFSRTEDSQTHTHTHIDITGGLVPSWPWNMHWQRGQKLHVATQGGKLSPLVNTLPISDWLRAIFSNVKGFQTKKRTRSATLPDQGPESVQELAEGNCLSTAGV